MIKLEEFQDDKVISEEYYTTLKKLCKEENAKRDDNTFSYFYLKRFSFPIDYKNFRLTKHQVK